MKNIVVSPEALKNASAELKRISREWSEECEGISEEEKRKGMKECGKIIADDYFKAKGQIDMLEEDLGAREKEIYDLKHELVANQMKVDSAQAQVKKLKAEIDELNKKVMRMEAAKH